MCKFTKNHLWIWQIGRFFIINRFCPKACVVIGYAISDVSLRLSGRIFLWEKYFLYYLCALKMNKPYTMNRKQILCISLLAFSLCACQDDDTADILDAFGTPPALTKMTAQEFLDQGEQMFEDGESVDEIVSADRAFYVNNPFNVSMADGKLRLFNGMAHDFKEVSLWLTMPHLRDTIQLMQFEEVPGFYNIKLDSPLKMGEVVYASKSGKPVRVNNLALLSPDQYELLLSCNDSVFDMLKTIKMKTRIQMGKYGSGNWGVMTANAARYYATSAVNMAFLAAGIGLTALITAVLLLVTACPPFSNWGFLIAERLCHGKWQDKRDKMKAQIDSMQEESLRLLKHSPRTAGGIFLCDFAKLTCWYLVPWFVLSADLPVSLWEIVCITAAAQMLAGVIPTPAGLGSLEFVFLMFSTKIVGAAEAGAAMILLRCAVNIIPLVPGALLALTDRRKKKGSRECPAE